MRAAAMFAAAYGFPPSACGSKEEAFGLLANIGQCHAAHALATTQGVGGALNPDALADILEAVGAPRSQVSQARFAAMRSESRFR